MLKQHFLFAFAAILLCFTACEEETFDPVLALGAAPAISAPADGASIVILEGTEDDEFATFSWSAADFGFPSGTIYTVEMDQAGNNFAEPFNLASGLSTTSVSIKNGLVNNELIGRGIEGGVATPIEVRVTGRVGTTEDDNVLTSNVLNLTVTPFAAERVYPALIVPGAHQGWAPDAVDAPKIFDTEENGNYDGYVYFADAANAFKFTTMPNWDENYGDTGADGTLDQNGDDIVAGDAGLYRLNVNINDLTFTYSPTNWGILGTSTPGGFDSDIDMAYDPATGIVSITLDLTAGEIKFRANDAWDINFGDNGADGKMEYGGDNIPVAEAGNYTIELFLNQPIYKYTITKN